MSVSITQISFNDQLFLHRASLAPLYTPWKTTLAEGASRNGFLADDQ